MILPDPPIDQDQVHEEVVTEKTRPALTRNQLDSIAEVKRQAILDEKAVEIAKRKESTISAKHQFSLYEANEISADQELKGKTFYVTGRIEDIGKDILDDIYVALKTDNFLFNVQCYIDDESGVANLRKGQKVTFLGKCDGKFGNVMMKSCELVQNLNEL